MRLAAKAYLFDLDGTLCHTEPLHFAAVRSVLGECGRTLDRHTFETRLAGQTTGTVFARLFPDLPEAIRTELVDRKERLFRDMASGLEPTPGVAEYIRRLTEAGVKLALVTNAPRIDVDYILEVLDMTDVFEVKIIATELSHPKPHPMPYLTALQECRVPASEAVAFEDSITGITSARIAGVRTIGLTTTLSHDELIMAGAAATIPDFRQEHLSDLALAAV